MAGRKSDFSMTENGVAKVWLHDEKEDTDCPCGCGDPDCDCKNPDCNGSCHKHGCGENHNFVVLETVNPTCKTLGYTRYLCVDCGKIEKRDYVNAIGHAWQGVVVRDATCEVGGKVLNICKNCGECEETTTPKGEHMTRSEAAAIFARLLAAKNGDTLQEYGSYTTKFTDVPANAWYASSVKYLTRYGVILGCGNDLFAPERPITRAEFTALAVRFFNAYGDGDAEIIEKYAEFTDVSEGYWAAKYIKDAAIHGWVFGYGDGTFGAEKSITRAEVVTLANRLLGWNADKSYVDKNIRKLTTFSDMTDKNHWAYYAVMEAANTHTATIDSSEIWSK